jgi:hypothetical protein
MAKARQHHPHLRIQPRPPPTGTHNVYSVHTPTGNLIDRITGDGIERQYALPTHGGTYLHFPKQVRQIGSLHSTDPQPIGYPTGQSDYSPSGDFGVAVSHTWSGNGCGYKASILKADGTIASGELNLDPSSMAVSETYTLVIGSCKDKVTLVSVDLSGAVKELPLPSDLATLSVADYHYPYLNYLGNDRFDLVKQGKSEDAKGNTVINSTSYEFLYGKNHNDSATPINVSSFSHTIPAEAAADKRMSDGGHGYILPTGDVYVLHRKENTAKRTGTVGHIGEIGKSGEYLNNELIYVYSPNTESLFGLRQGRTITIRKWSQPEQVMATLSFDEHAKACGPNLCRIREIDVIP